MAHLDKIFKAAINLNASDVHVVPGEPIVIRRLARMIKSKSEKLSPDNARRIILEILTEAQKKSSCMTNSLILLMKYRTLADFAAAQ